MRRPLAPSLAALALFASSGAAQVVLQTPVPVTAPTVFPSALDAGDLDGDGDEDLVVSANGFPARLVSYLNDGAGGLVPGPLDEAGIAYNVPTLGDYDGDDVLDMVAFEAVLGDTLVFRQGLGNGDFGPRQGFGVDSIGADVATADFDNDGHLDVAVASSSGLIPGQFIEGGLEVFLGDGTGAFASSYRFVTFFGSNAVEVGDLDLDGDPDMVASSLNTMNPEFDLRRFVNPGDGAFEDPAFLQPVGTGFELVDVNGDDQLDIVAIRDDLAGLFVHEGLPGGFFAKAVATPLGQLSAAVHAVDLDGDGSTEVVIPRFSQSAMELEVLTSDGGLGFDPVLVLSKAAGSVPIFPDLDGDGLPDIVLGSGADDRFYLVFNATYGAGEPFSDLGGANPGVEGWPLMVASGDLLPGGTLQLELQNGLPGAPVFLVVGTSQLDAPFLGGVLVPSPERVLPVGAVGADGRLLFTKDWPAGPALAEDLVMQLWFVDAGGAEGFAATTGVRAAP